MGGFSEESRKSPKSPNRVNKETFIKKLGFWNPEVKINSKTGDELMTDIIEVDEEKETPAATKWWMPIAMFKNAQGQEIAPPLKMMTH